MPITVYKYKYIINEKKKQLISISPHQNYVQLKSVKDKNIILKIKKVMYFQT